MIKFNQSIINKIQFYNRIIVKDNFFNLYNPLISFNSKYYPHHSNLKFQSVKEKKTRRMKIVLLFLIGLIAYGQCLPPKSRIIGGDPADISNFPYVCSVNAPTSLGRGHVCGCSILSEHWVLTAAHCVRYVRIA